MATPAQFVLEIGAWVKKAKVAPDAVLRKVCLDLLSGVIARTPVDYGVLRGNWQVALATPPSGKVNVRDPTGDLAKRRGMAVIGTAKWGTDVFIVNNLPYAVTVEYGGYPNPPKRGTYVPSGKRRYGIMGPGWVKRSAGGFSKQAPAGMVRVTVVEVQQKLDEIARSVRS